MLKYLNHRTSESCYQIVVGRYDKPNLFFITYNTINNFPNKISVRNSFISARFILRTDFNPARLNLFFSAFRKFINISRRSKANGSDIATYIAILRSFAGYISYRQVRKAKSMCVNRYLILSFSMCHP